MIHEIPIYKSQSTPFNIYLYLGSWDCHQFSLALAVLVIKRYVVAFLWLYAPKKSSVPPERLFGRPDWKKC